MGAALNGHQAQPDRIAKWVWYGGTDALKQGEGVCYNTDYGTATAINARRANLVERPSTSNNEAFAGVAERDYAAQSGGQLIEINVPGSRGVLVALSVDTVINTGILSFQAGGGTGAGRFTTGRFLGRGSAIPRQTVTALLEDGRPGVTISVDATDGVTVTVADSSDYAAGDILLILAAEMDGTGIPVMGKHVISSITDGTTIVLAASCLSTLSTGSLTLTAVVYSGNPKAQCDLLTGEESGGAEFLSPLNAGQVGIAYMATGITYIPGIGTLAADCDVTLAQGTRPYIKKKFFCLGEIGTSDFTLDLATTGLRLDGATGLTDINELDNLGDGVYLEFHGALWHTMDLVGGAVEA